MMGGMATETTTARAEHLELARLVGRLEHALDELARDGLLDALDAPCDGYESIGSYREARAAISAHFDADRPGSPAAPGSPASGARAGHLQPASGPTPPSASPPLV